MKIETWDKIWSLVNSGIGWTMYDIATILVTHEGMLYNRNTREKAKQVEDLIIRFHHCHHHEYFERQQYHRWQRMNSLIMTKVCNGLPVTQAEKIHCNQALLNAELYTY